MSTKAPNRAAQLPSKGARLEVVERSIPTPGAGQLVVRNHAVAVNPVDWKIQDYGIFITDYPAVLGSDVAGEVVAVGSDVTNFKTGDRVLAYGSQLATKNNDEGAWQTYTLVNALVTSKLSNSVKYEEGAVFPLSLATAAMALFADIGIPMAPRKSTDQGALLVWSAASSVGITAVQLASSLGWTVYATASPKHHDWIKKLGAKQLWDYRDSDVAKKIAEAAKADGLKLVGAYDAVSEGDSFTKVRDTVNAVGAVSGAKIAVTLEWPKDLEKPAGVEVAGTFAARVVMDRKDIGEWSFKWLENGLADGTVKAAPEPQIVEGGIDSAQKAYDTLKAGVSGKKIVVRL